MQDAIWITASNSINCTTADEVLLLLKSSDRAAHDICNAFDGCSDKPQQEIPHVLVLKKYYDLKPEREFRCFVQGHDLVGKISCCLHVHTALLFSLPQSCQMPQSSASQNIFVTLHDQLKFDWNTFL